MKNPLCQPLSAPGTEIFTPARVPGTLVPSALAEKGQLTENSTVNNKKVDTVAINTFMRVFLFILLSPVILNYN